MKPYAIVAEGPDDIAALRALLRSAGAQVAGGIHEAHRSPLAVTLNGESVQVWSALGKKKELAERTILAAQGTATFRPEVAVVCFDPDGDGEASEFSFFAESFEAVRRDRVRALTVTDESTSFRIANREVTVVAAAWRHDDAARFADLPEDHNLERLLLTGVLRAESATPRFAWAEEATRSLVSIVKDHGWKRAFRIWNAAVAPKSEAFVDALLQDQDLKRECLAALQESRAWKAIVGLH